MRCLQHTQIARGDQRMRVVGIDQITSELPCRKLVERHVLVEGVDDPVAIRRDGVVLIAVIADGVGEPYEVEPVARHAFSVARRIEQTVDPPLVLVVAWVGQVSLDRGRFGWQPCQVQGDSSQKRVIVGWRRGG